MMQQQLQRFRATNPGAAAVRHVPCIAGRVRIAQRLGSAQRLKVQIAARIAAVRRLNCLADDLFCPNRQH
jgi:hypothetical protein